MKPKDILSAAAAIGMFYLTTFAFTTQARREIGYRDKWECQCGCGRRFQDGWHVQAAHLPELHQKEPDTNIQNGRILATECHMREEIRRGNINGARLLYNTQSVRQNRWIEENGYDEKQSFEHYIETAYEQDSILIEA